MNKELKNRVRNLFKERGVREANERTQGFSFITNPSKIERLERSSEKLLSTGVVLNPQGFKSLTEATKEAEMYERILITEGFMAEMFTHTSNQGSAVVVFVWEL